MATNLHQTSKATKHAAPCEVNALSAALEQPLVSLLGSGPSHAATQSHSPILDSDQDQTPPISSTSKTSASTRIKQPVSTMPNTHVQAQHPGLDPDSHSDPTIAGTGAEGNANHAQSQPVPNHQYPAGVHDPRVASTRVQPYQPPFTLTRGNNYGSGYPHSLLGLHELPHTIPANVSRATEDWARREFSMSTHGPGAAYPDLGDHARTQVPVDTNLGVHRSREKGKQAERHQGTLQGAFSSLGVPDGNGTGMLNHLLPPGPQEYWNVEPSLGPLDTALAFIASERERIIAGSASAPAQGGPSLGNSGGNVNEHGVDGEEGEGDGGEF